MQVELYTLGFLVCTEECVNEDVKKKGEGGKGEGEHTLHMLVTSEY